MVNLQFTLVETLWKSFWRFSEAESLSLYVSITYVPRSTFHPQTKCDWVLFHCRHNESEKRLPKSCLVVLCKFEPVLCWTKECDNLLYQTLVDMLIPNVLRPIPSKFSTLKDKRLFNSGLMYGKCKALFLCNPPSQVP